MAKYKHLIIVLFALVVPVLASVLFSSTASAAITVRNLEWRNDSTIVGEIFLNNNWRSVTFAGTPPTLNTTVNHTVGSSGGMSVPRQCESSLTLTMNSATAGTVTANVTEGPTQCSDAVTGGVEVNGANAPDGVEWASAGGADGEGQSSCNIDGVGWLICPVVVFFGNIIDTLYSTLEGLFLMTEPLSTSTGSPTYQVWSQVRNVANLAFILAFLMIVFSHVSSIGLSNYNIKKMLPRLVIAAVLVNISYWICTIAIDASNIIGFHSKSIFDEAVTIEGFGADDGPWNQASWWSTIVTLVIAGGVIYVAHISILFPVLIAALAALVTVVAVLLLREALIILLVVISPLAFVAFLLPNTESWFSKWRKFLTTLLLMYPAIGAIFGASQLASKVVMASSEEIPVQITGAAISIIPLFITPIIMRTAGGVLNRFAGIVNNRDKGVFDRMRKGAAGYRERRTAGMDLRAMRGDRKVSFRRPLARRRARNAEEKRSLERGMNKESAAYVASKVKSDEVFRDKLAGGGAFERAPEAATQSVQASAISTIDSLKAEEVKAATALIAEANLPADKLQSLALGKGTVTHGGFTFSSQDDVTRTAAIDAALKVATVKEAERLVDISGSMTEGQRQHLSAGLISTGLVNKAPHLSGQTLGDIEQGNIVNSDGILTEEQQQRVNKGGEEEAAKLKSLDATIERAATSGKFSAQAIATSHPATLERLEKILPNLAPGVQESIRDKIKEAVTLPSTAGLIQPGQEQSLQNMYGSSLKELREQAKQQSAANAPQGSPIPTPSQEPQIVPSTQQAAGGELKIEHNQSVTQPSSTTVNISDEGSIFTQMVTDRGNPLGSASQTTIATPPQAGQSPSSNYRTQGTSAGFYVDQAGRKTPDSIKPEDSAAFHKFSEDLSSRPAGGFYTDHRGRKTPDTIAPENADDFHRQFPS